MLTTRRKLQPRTSIGRQHVAARQNVGTKGTARQGHVLSSLNRSPDLLSRLAFNLIHGYVVFAWYGLCFKAHEIKKSTSFVATRVLEDRTRRGRNGQGVHDAVYHTTTRFSVHRWRR
jgi:hypothetical protein